LAFRNILARSPERIRYKFSRTLPERVSLGSFWSEALGLYTEDSKRIIGGGGPVAKIAWILIKASHLAMAGFFYSLRLLLKSVPTVKDRAQLPDPHLKNLPCNLSII
jgi:hypothetical protein